MGRGWGGPDAFWWGRGSRRFLGGASGHFFREAVFLWKLVRRGGRGEVGRQPDKGAEERTRAHGSRAQGAVT